VEKDGGKTRASLGFAANQRNYTGQKYVAFPATVSTTTRRSLGAVPSSDQNSVELRSTGQRRAAVPTRAGIAVAHSSETDSDELETGHRKM